MTPKLLIWVLNDVSLFVVSLVDIVNSIGFRNIWVFVRVMGLEVNVSYITGEIFADVAKSLLIGLIGCRVHAH